MDDLWSKPISLADLSSAQLEGLRESLLEEIDIHEAKRRGFIDTVEAFGSESPFRQDAAESIRLADQYLEDLRANSTKVSTEIANRWTRKRTAEA